MFRSFIRTNELAFIISNAISSTLFTEQVSIIYINFFVTKNNKVHQPKNTFIFFFMQVILLDFLTELSKFMHFKLLLLQLC